MPTVFITGASRGIGLEFARQYKADGWKVIATCRDPDGAPDLRATGAEVHALDVTDPAALSALGRTLTGRTLDVLINNAGVYPLKGPQGSFGDIAVAPWMEALRTNTIAPWKIAETFIANLMAAERPVLATISSKMGSIADAASPGSVVYRSSKTAANMVVKAMALELGPRGVICLSLHPGWVLTEMGGPNALITTTQSVAGMRGVIARATPANSGCFYAYDGQEIPW